MMLCPDFLNGSRSLVAIKLINPSNCPPNGYTHFQKETRQWFHAITLPDLKSKVRNHRKANNIPIGLLFDEQIEEDICSRTPPGWCERDGVGISSQGIGTSLETVKQGTATLFDWWKNDRRVVSQSELDKRAGICASCPFNQPYNCPSCALSALHALVNHFTSAISSKHDHLLNACSKCGCSLKAKTRIPLDILQRHIPKSQDDSLPEWCWVKKKENNA